MRYRYKLLITKLAIVIVSMALTIIFVVCYRDLSNKIDNFTNGLPSTTIKSSFSNVTPYYIVKSIESFSNLVFADDGTPLVFYKNFGLRRNPVTIAEYALCLVNNYIHTGKISYKKQFIHLAQWFVKNASWDRGYATWNYEFPFLNMQPPWISSMAQGQIISVLIRAYQLTGDCRFLDISKSAMTSFYLNVDDGGVARRDAHGRLILEEYPTNPPSMVLNGYLYAVFGIFDYWKETGDTNAGNLFRECIASIGDLVEDYDTGLWSRYDSPSYGYSGWAPVRYHMLHIRQLNILYELTNNAEFKHIADRWLKYSMGVKNRLAYIFVSNLYKAKRILFGVPK